eukprot:IDg5036t1
MYEAMRTRGGISKLGWRCKKKIATAIDPTIEQACFNVRVGKETVVEWWNSCRATAAKSLESLPLFVGTEDCPVQADEAMVAGQEKYRKGRRLSGDKTENNNDDVD